MNRGTIILKQFVSINQKISLLKKKKENIIFNFNKNKHFCSLPYFKLCTLSFLNINLI